MIEMIDAIFIKNPINFMVFIFIIGLSMWEFMNKNINLKPEIISIGVLGTFVGIIIGLWHFNTNNIEESIPLLLNGLKTSFITSIMGMVASILLSIWSSYNHQPNSDNDTHNTLFEISKKLNELSTISLSFDGLNDIYKSNEKSNDILSIVSSKLDKLDSIDKTIKDSLSDISKGLTTEVFEALQDIIKDFNNNLTDQFGENFKQLNEGVKNLVEWQDNYKDTIILTTELLKCDISKIIEQSNNVVEKNNKSIESITNNYKTISETANQIGEVSKLNSNQIKLLDSQLKRFGIANNEINDFGKSLSNFSNEIKSSIESQSTSLSNLTNGIEQELPKALGALNTTLTSLVTSFGTSFKELLDYNRSLVELETKR